MTSIDILKPPETDEESGQILSAHLPVGRAWGDKNTPGSNMNGLINGLSAVFNAVQNKTYELAQEFNIYDTYNLLEEWETSVGIPDDCVFVYSDADDRRNRVIQRLRKTPVVTLAEVQAYIEPFFVGYTVVITTGEGSEGTEFEYTFEMEFLGNTNNRFLISAEISAGGDFGRLYCLLRNILPANVAITTSTYVASITNNIGAWKNTPNIGAWQGVL